VANIVTGATAAVWSMRKVHAVANTFNLLATVAYVFVTILLFQLFRPVSRRVSLVAALFSFVGCIAALIDTLGRLPKNISPLMFFGVYCLLIGYLIMGSWFLPKILGVFLAIGGLGWLTFALPLLSKQLFPYNMAPGILTKRNIVQPLAYIPGLNEARWRDQARAADALTFEN
jgi:hypothetical protein